MKRYRILLVDDTPEVLAYCAEILKPDYDIVGTATNGRAAIHTFAATLPDVIVLDISMPGMSGIEVAKRLRNSGCRATIVFMSADDHFAKQALEAGGSAYVSKTLIADLPIAIAEALAGRPFVSASALKREDLQ